MDVSNYTGHLSEAQALGLQEEGIAFLIAGTQNESVTRQQLRIAIASEMDVDAYVMLYPGDTDSQVLRGIEVVYGLPIGRLWLDVEVAGLTLDHVRRASRICETNNIPWGIYTSRSKWQELTGDSDELSSAPLWAAFYDGVPNLDNWGGPYGGWKKPMVKQYQGSTQLAGVLCDINVREGT